MAKVTFIKNSSPSTTVTDQLSGTAVNFAGPKGIVRACAFSTVKTTTFLLKGRETGREVIPNGSGSQGMLQNTSGTGAVDAQCFIYEAMVKPGEPLELTITPAGAQDSIVGVQTE